MTSVARSDYFPARLLSDTPIVRRAYFPARLCSIDRLRRRQSLQKRIKLVEIYGLRDVFVAAGGQRVGVEIGRIVCRDGDYRNLTQVGLFAYTACGGQTVEQR